MPKFSTDTMIEMLELARAEVPESSTWRHYKGGVYMIEGHTVLTDHDAIGVIYRRVDGPGFHPLLDPKVTFCRPLREWFEDADTSVMGEAVTTKRFIRVQKVETWGPFDGQA